MAGEVEVRYVHRVKFSEPAGHWVKASSWDFAWDLDSGLKTLDRPNIPRLLPSVRMRAGKSTGEIAQPAFGNDEKWKTVASIYLPDLPNKVGGIVVKAQCGGDRDGNDYRFHLVEYMVKPVAKDERYNIPGFGQFA